jgi:glycine cleavage system regulatory protein
MSGEKLFRAKARLRAPEGVTRETLEEALEEIAASLMADVTFDETEA